MATNENLIPIPGRLHSVANGGHVAGADEIFDDDRNLLQSTLNNAILEEKAYNAADYSGMGRVYLKKNMVNIAEEGEEENIVNLLTQADFQDDSGNDLENTIFVIQYDFTLGEDITIPNNCILEFNGGSISASGSNDTIIGTNTQIKAGSEYIFNNISLIGKFNNLFINVSWFGANESNLDNSGQILAAIKTAAITEIGVVKFPAKTYNIANPIIISKDSIADDDNLNGLSLIGTRSAFESVGTTFNFTSESAFLDIQLQHTGDHWKKIIIDSIKFTSNNTSIGVRLSHVQNGQFKNCSFVKLTKGVVITNDSHLNVFENCFFKDNSCAIYIPNSEDPLFINGGNTAANNNFIKQCWFEYNNEVLDLTRGASTDWTIENCDIEGNNGVLRLSNNNYLTNIRIERNLNKITWLDIPGSFNKVDVSFYWDSIRQESTPLYVSGSNNKIRAYCMGDDKERSIVNGAYGQMNDYDIHTSHKQGIYVFGINDIIKIDGVSNRGGIQQKSVANGVTNNQNSSTGTYTLFGSTNAMMAGGSITHSLNFDAKVGDRLFLTFVGYLKKRGTTGENLFLTNLFGVKYLPETPCVMISANSPYDSEQTVTVNATISLSGAHPVQLLCYYANYSLNGPSFNAFDGGNTANLVEASDKDGITIHVQNISELSGFSHGLTDTTNFYFECKGKLYKNAGINQTPTPVN